MNAKGLAVCFLLLGLQYLPTFQHLLYAQACRIDIRLDMRQDRSTERVGIRGNIPPLSWDKTIYLQDGDSNGIFTGTLTLERSKAVLEYKFVRNGDEFELSSSDNRHLALDQEKLNVVAIFNQYEQMSEEQVAAIRFDSAAIREDLHILKTALQTIHPNLYRYTDSMQLEQEWGIVEQQLLTQRDLSSMYRQLSRFLARIKCSHTMINPWNQNWRTKSALYFQADKLPFTFRLIDQKMFLERNASTDHRLQAGVEILSINGFPIDVILERLLSYLSADGNNTAKRFNMLQMNGLEKYELFDILLPLEFGIRGSFELRVLDHRQGQEFVTQVPAVTKSSRTAILQERYPTLMATGEPSWTFTITDAQSAYLRLPSFDIWNMEMDWKQFLRDAFRQLHEKQIPNLIIDIRGNVGGADEVYAFILERLVQKEIHLENYPTKVAYRQIPEQLRPFLSTWEQSVYDLGDRVIRQPDGYYQLKDQDKSARVFKARKDGYRGHTFLLTDASNSSATHIMAGLMQRYQLGTLVGETTGGNQKGINGGVILFTTLPNSGIEIDIPVFGRYVPEEVPDSGIVPAVLVPGTVADQLSGRDAALEAIHQLIRDGKH